MVYCIVKSYIWYVDFLVFFGHFFSKKDILVLFCEYDYRFSHCWRKFPTYLKFSYFYSRDMSCHQYAAMLQFLRGRRAGGRENY